ncbi:MAG: hypothetical protein KAW47_05920 [Thermoplasmatales archaeon]|nr:hypothetical protein [Thermoplasmatales archaeon]
MSDVKKEIIKMGFFDLLFAGKRMEEIKMALVGKYVFDALINDDQKSQVATIANQRFKEGTSPSDSRSIDDLDLRVRYIFFGLAMAELGIDHGLNGFQWTYVRNPFVVRTYDEKLWRTTIESLNKKYTLNVSL